MVNCRVQTQQGGEVIFLNEDTSILKSPKKFVIPDEHQSSIGSVELCELPSLTNNTTVNVIVNVMELSPPEQIINKAGKVYKKQDCVIADHTACSRIVLWEEDLGQLLIDGSYKLQSVTVRCYDSLSVNKNSHIISVDDIGDITTLQSGDIDRPVISRVVVARFLVMRRSCDLSCIIIDVLFAGSFTRTYRLLIY